MERELESGIHNPEEWIRLLFGLQASGFSGHLPLTSGHKSRHFLFLQGHATDFWSDFKDESLFRTLTKAKLVESNALLDLSDSEAEIAAVSEKLLSEEQLESHQIQRVEDGLKIPLKVKSGSWTAKKVPKLEEIAIPRALYSRTRIFHACPLFLSAFACACPPCLAGEPKIVAWRDNV